MSIPKIVHYVWVGPRALPQEEQRRVAKWRELLPDWEFRLWDNDALDFSSPYLRMTFAVRAWSRISDYIRMDALTKFGGVYLDSDVELVRPLDPLLDRAAFLGFQAGDEMSWEMVNGAVFGAQRGHWLPRLIRTMFDEKFDGRVDVGARSGPGLLTEILREHGLSGYSDTPVDVKDVTIFPKRYFYPYNWEEAYSPAVITPDTFAVHHWARSWVKSQSEIKARIRRAALKLFARVAPEYALRSAQNSCRGTTAIPNALIRTKP